MPALLLLLFGAGLVYATYTLSPSARARINDYLLAIRATHEAHREAEAHLHGADKAAQAVEQHKQRETEQAPSRPEVADAHANAGQIAQDAGVDQVLKAKEANQKAAKNVTEAAKHAQTDAQRTEVAQNAQKVTEREQQIVDTLAKLGVGQCEARAYPKVTSQIKDQILARLQAAGMAVTGDTAGPWNVDTHNHGVRLRAAWDPTKQILKVIVTAGAGGPEKGEMLPSLICPLIWKEIDPIMKALTSS